MGDIVDVAISQLGYKESNGSTKYGAWMNMSAASWCHLFASWCANEAGCAAYAPKTASCATGEQWFKNKKRWGAKGSYTPVRNDFIYFRNGGHVGVVEYVNGNKVHSIDGNYSDSVKRVTYNLSDSDIDGYGKVGEYISSSGSGSSDDDSKTYAENLKYVKNMLKKANKQSSADDGYLSNKTVTIQQKAYTDKQITVFVQRGKYTYYPNVLDGASITLERKNVAGKFEFEMLKNKKYKPREGDVVAVIIGKVKFFYGFIFSVNRTKSDTLSVTAYDQLRYFKNKDTYIYKKKTTDQLIRMIAKDFGLNCGKLSNTKYAISRVEDAVELFDMIGNSLTETTAGTGEIYTMYDQYGSLRLRKPWHVDGCLIDADTSQDYDYQSTIDSNVYNQVKLYYDNSDTGKREIYMVKSTKNINKWGTLQLYEKTEMPETAKLQAKMLLDLYNRKARTLSIKDVYGNAKVRAGCLVPVMLDLGDVKVSNYMLVDKVTHKFGAGYYAMDLNVSGGKFDGTESG